MDYEIGSATDAHDMLNKIRLFLVANGWTQDDYASETYGYRLNMHRGALYINMFSTLGYDAISTYSWTSTTYALHGIAFSPATGYTASPGGTKAWKNMPGVPSLSGYADNAFACCVAHMTGAVTSYHMAADGDNFICAMETETGFYRWVAFGSLVAYGTVGPTPNGFYLGTSNGMYNDGNVSGATGVELQRLFAHRLTSAANRNAALRFNDTWYLKESGARIVHPIPTISYTAPSNVNDLYWGLVHPLYMAMPGDIGGLAPLLPVQIGVEYSGYEVPVGHFDLARITNMNCFSVGQQITVGSEDFVVLPVPSAESLYYQYAIAIRITGA